MVLGLALAFALDVVVECGAKACAKGEGENSPGCCAVGKSLHIITHRKFLCPPSL